MKHADNFANEKKKGNRSSCSKNYTTNSHHYLHSVIGKTRLMVGMGTLSEEPVPSVAVRWLVYNSTCNADLAVLSNVSRAWRDVVAECVVDSCNGDSPKLFENFLLPSWIKHQSRSNRSLLDDDDDETYCLAWFHPGGLKYKPLIPKNAKEAEHSARVICRWQGYREAADVFKPFGYSQYLLKVSKKCL